ncbi:MAG: hypothetical protein ACI9MR_002337 [Myxococcota bacterium]|jgi:hypothetical protein
MRRLASAAIVLSGLAFGSSAAAFEPFVNSDGVPLFWGTDTIALAVNADIPPQFTMESVETAARAGANVWLSQTCAPKTFVLSGFFDGLLESQADGVNAVLWLDEAAWNARFDSSEVARTIITFRDSGEIVDADILVNAGAPVWSHGDACVEGAYDFRSAIAHEFGHLLGLNHSLVDDATMVDSYNRGECDKRVLAMDDIDGYCSTYVAQVVEPADEDVSDVSDATDTSDSGETTADTVETNTAETVGPSGGSNEADCAASGSDAGLGWLLLFAIGGWQASWRRRQRRRPSPAR